MKMFDKCGRAIHSKFCKKLKGQGFDESFIIEKTISPPRYDGLHLKNPTILLNLTFKYNSKINEVAQRCFDFQDDIKIFGIERNTNEGTLTITESLDY